MFDQIAFRVPDPTRAMRLLNSLLKVDMWTADQVQAYGKVRGEPAINTAQLFFNYRMFPATPVGKGVEFELLRYESGENWHEGLVDEEEAAFASHIGKHVDDVKPWIAWAERQGLDVIQHVKTIKHTNPNVPKHRKYEYVIIDTRAILGFDIKLIKRLTFNMKEL